MARLAMIGMVLGLVFGGAAAGGQPYTTDPALLMRPMMDGDVAVIEPRGMALYDPMGTELVPTITVTDRGPLSADIVYEFKNTTGRAATIGRLNVGILALGERINVYDHAGTSEWRDVRYDTFQGFAWLYPGHAYSPVMVAMNQTHVVGISLLYPVMEYRHDAGVRLHRVGGVFGGPPERRGWMVTFDFSNPPGANQYTRIVYPAVLGPGERRTYTVAVRAMKRPDLSGSVTGEQKWLEVLRPYTEHFGSLYGGVTYERETEPVQAWELAGGYQASATNRRGFGGGENRPDRVGFGPVARQIAASNGGYGAVMLWAPSGVFLENAHNNFPSRFTAGWLDQERLRTATDATGLPAIARSGKELGLWWGRAAEHMDRWEDDVSEPLNPGNPGHMSLVRMQLDLARDAGATLIGLDAFTHGYMPAWEQVGYLEDLRRQYPEMRFITEPMTSDVVHRVSPTFERAFRSGEGMRREEDFHRMPVPHYLADSLLPGHEIWGYFRYSEIQRVPGQRVDADRVQRDAERVARNGYRVVMASAFPLSSPSRVRASATWETTVPGEPGPAGESDSSDGQGASDVGESSSESPSAVDEPKGSAETVSQPEEKPGAAPEARRVRYITLPDGRRIRVREG